MKKNINNTSGTTRRRIVKELSQKLLKKSLDDHKFVMSGYSSYDLFDFWTSKESLSLQRELQTCLRN